MNLKLSMQLVSPRAEAPRIFYRGDQATFRLAVAGAPPGQAMLRTNLGNGAILCDEIIRFTEDEVLPSGCGWCDLKMRKCAGREGEFELTVALNQVGRFEAKAGWRADADERWYWPDGPNLVLKVEPAESVGANLIYTAFVRQFGNHGTRHPETEAELEGHGCTVIPPSGTFRDLIGELDFIFGKLGSRILQLLPIHPAPTVYGKMGRYGSPFAALDYFAVDPALAEFDESATPLEQFQELVDAVHSRHGRIFLDIPVNHTGWASRLQNEHPEWFVRGADGRFESPGAWGVVWADLCKLDYRAKPVHMLLAEVFGFWCRHGVDGFRCDAGYMLPEEAWEYVVARVRREFPDVIFLLEGLGGPIPKQERLLDQADLDWAYSELFQNYDYDAVKTQQAYIAECSRRFGLLVNFAETHDNSRLAAVSPTWSRMRLALCALSSVNGAFGFANGVEWLATEQINVHENRDLRWGASPNLLDYIRRLQKLLAGNPAFYAGSRIEWLDGAAPVVMLKRSAPEGGALLALVNLDCDRPARARWRRDDFDVASGAVEVMGGVEAAAGITEFELEPGGCAVLLGPQLGISSPAGTSEPAPVVEQRTRFLAQSAWCHWRGGVPEELPEPAELAKMMREDYSGFLARAARQTLPPVAWYRIPEDARREVIIANGDLLSVAADQPFRAAVWRGKEEVLALDWSVPTADGVHRWHAALPENPDREIGELKILISIFRPGAEVERHVGVLRQLPKADRTAIDLDLSGGSRMDRRSYWLASNAYGGMAQVRARWGEIHSKYDGWLAANLGSDFPRDRRLLLSRVRGWVVVDAYSQELSCNCTLDFIATAENVAKWRFSVPAGAGRLAELEVELALALDGDAVRARFRRLESASLPAHTPVRLILRPDLDDRINHQVTKAYRGPEKSFPAAVKAEADGFIFAPDPARKLEVRLPKGRFVPEPEWRYMVDLTMERYYGLDSSTDIFSPGYFEVDLKHGADTILEARANSGAKPPAYPEAEFKRKWKPDEAARAALERFVVRRGDLSTVIAGYPWFLDWGRDTLIALRGLIAAGMLDQARAAILQFARFEDRGTIPNMISGSDVSNRDTSDAPLWLFVAVGDYLDATGDKHFLESDAGGRTVFEVLNSIVDHYRSGTPNGIAVDPASNLVFSPPHFTWMDTNHPAATPREGYPAEIQALWYYANRFLAVHGRKDLAEAAAEIRAGIERYFFAGAACSDCLHGAKGTPAERAAADDACRPNMLFLVTLGAIEDPAKRAVIVAAAGSLVVPGGIRTLADRPVKPPLPVRHDGKMLNDPDRPYQGFYRGPEDTARKVAYHNGTAWCWPFPSYAEALFMTGGIRTRQRALAILYSTLPWWHSGAMGNLPEVLDGDAPHRWGGCGAQAWSVSEFYRVEKKLRG